MKIMYQIAIIFSVCWISQVIEALLPFAFPASVIGMVLLFLLLCTGALRMEHIREKSDFLLSNMAFFFVPAGVSIINYADVLRSSAVQLVIICLVTTVLTFGATAWSIRLTLHLMERRGRK
ncbi:MAG: CidA/LrgA family protein [Pseudoflavonifractor sp.]|nr:CidA/LrgA family protein [Pseudoflavonifractor sp.]